MSLHVSHSESLLKTDSWAPPSGLLIQQFGDEDQECAFLSQADEIQLVPELLE